MNSPTASTTQQQPVRVAFVGAGNVATHMVRRLSQSHDKIEIVGICARTASSARRLAAEAGASTAVAASVADLPLADLYIVSVNDDAVADIMASTADNGAVWVHTSGSVALEAISSHRRSAGVLYPLQTFSRDAEIDWEGVAILTESTDELSAAIINRVAKALSANTYAVASDVRAQVHIAAVIACNFTNYLYTLAQDQLSQVGLPLQTLYGLIDATVAKMKAIGPVEAQTGPARRGDKAVIARHEAMLTPDVAEIYKILSNNILARYNK